MKSIISRIFLVIISLTIASYLATLFFGNTSWLSGTGLTEYDKAYISEGGVLRKAGESALYPISRTYEDFGRRVQEEITYDWSVLGTDTFYVK